MITLNALIFVSVISWCIAGVPLRQNVRKSNAVSPNQIERQLPSSPLSDVLTNSDLKAFSKTIEAFSPVLTFGTLTYVAYAGLSLLIPSALAKMDMPKLEITRIESRSFKNSVGMEDLAGELIKSLVSRTEAAETAIAASKIILKDSAAILKNVRRTALSRGLKMHSVIDKLIKSLSPECVTNYMCRVGQFTNFRFPIIGALIRSLDNKHLDDFSKALIDGTTVGDCSGIFYECELEDEWK